MRASVFLRLLQTSVLANQIGVRSFGFCFACVLSKTLGDTIRVRLRWQLCSAPTCGVSGRVEKHR